MDDGESRLAAVERRLRQLEDERAIGRLIAAYGPLADSGNAEQVAALWESDGSYDVDGWVMRGRSQIESMIRSDGHRKWIDRGCAHFVGPPHVTVDGDAAVAICHSLMIVNDEHGRRIRRATANRWELRRHGLSWLVRTRTTRLLDGSAESSALLDFTAPGHSPQNT